MANYSNRGGLPLREDTNSRAGLSERIDHQILSKLTRCELEDKVLRLLDEKTHQKKLINGQEEKIKRLGAKLLRLLNEKKTGKKNSEQSKGEDLNLRIIELEHENYTLKDKNTVLKQQLASHSRHMTAHRSPVRTSHTSPMVSGRQTAPPIHSETVYEEATKKEENDSQLREAEAHIKELNDEIKSLHCKIEDLHQNMERNNLDSRKIKVTENIELIRLQRSLKQQSIQIASLQAQIKNSENTHKVLKEELIKAHNDNDEALQLISVKQNEILNLCSKLDEKNLNRLEEDELRERVHDLTLERDSLKERSELLMRTIRTKAEEFERLSSLPKSSEEKSPEQKSQSEKPEKASVSTQTCLDDKEKQITAIEVSGEVSEEEMKEKKKENWSTKIEGSSREFETRLNESSFSLCSKINYFSPESETSADSPPGTDKEKQGENDDNSEMTEGKLLAEKVKLEREVQYLREMLRSQTCRCEAQQAEINRLMYQLQVNEKKCNETLQRLDLHLTIFESLELRDKKKNSEAVHGLEKVNSSGQASLDFDKPTKSDSLRKTSEVSCADQQPLKSDNHVQTSSDVERKIRYVSESEKFEPFDMESDRCARTEEESLRSSPVRQSDTSGSETSTKNTSVKLKKPEAKKRFVEKVFLESSDEDIAKEDILDRESFLSKLEALDNQTSNSGISYKSQAHLKSNDQQYKKVLKSNRRLSSRLTSIRESFKYVDTVVITILWLKLESKGSLWKDDSVKLLFVDFSFLDVNGEETETQSSLPKPKNPEDKCSFGFSKVIEITDSRKNVLLPMLNRYDLDIVIFKVVSDPEDFYGEYESEDVGVAVVTVNEFLRYCGDGAFTIQVKNVNDMKEIVGKLAVSIEVTYKYNMI